jgi:hypothetical protein
VDPQGHTQERFGLGSNQRADIPARRRLVAANLALASAAQGSDDVLVEGQAAAHDLQAQVVLLVDHDAQGNIIGYNPERTAAAALRGVQIFTDIINIAFLKIDNDLPNWKRDQVKISRKLVYKPDDPRVDLSNKGIMLQSEEISTDHSPVVGPEAVGYIFIKFILDRPIKSPNVTVKLTVQIGDRTDIIELTNSDATSNPTADLQIWSDKYFNETIAKVKIDVEVAPPPSDFAGDAVTWSGVQAVPLNLGRIKRIVPFTINVPKLTDPAQNALVGQYILETLKELSAVKV